MYSESEAYYCDEEHLITESVKNMHSNAELISSKNSEQILVLILNKLDGKFYCEYCKSEIINRLIKF